MTGQSLEKPWTSVWPMNVPKSLAYPDITLGELLRNSASKFHDAPAIYFSDIEITFRELDKLADHFAKGLQGLGVRKGDRVAIYLPNLPEFVVTYYGTLRMGGVVVAISPLYKERELSHILNDSEATVIICWDKLRPIVEAVKEKAKVKITISTDSERTPGIVGLQTLLAKYSGSPTPVELDGRKDLALLQYTGGTTGTPKGAMLTHYNLIANAVQFSAWLNMKNAGETHLAVLPFFHIYGMTVALNVPVYTASPMILVPDPRNTEAILQAVNMRKPSIFCGVPSTYIALINHPNVKHYDLRSIRVCVSGASPLPLQVQKQFEALTGGRLVEGYGLTEASPVTHVNPLGEPSKNRSGSIGIPISDTDSRIVDLETGDRQLPAGEIGELVVRGPQIMMGYWNNMEDTKTALRNGWVYTGDIAVMEVDGYFRIVDRKKDMINVSGFKVWPREVEEVLFEHPSVKEAAVVPVPDAITGEAVKAYVVIKKEYRNKVTASELTEFCRGKVASYKIPKTIEVRDTLPKSSVGKILRRELRTPSLR
jgi:long-chain acyl-CoA synthetase